MKLLEHKNIKILLSADDDRISYSLSPIANLKLISQGSLVIGDMRYLRTDVRVERDNFFMAILTHCFDDELVVFTHEWALGRINWLKEILIIIVLKSLNCNFIID